MDEYLTQMLDSPGLFAIILAFTTLVYVAAGRKTSVGWLDPWLTQQFLTAAASATVFFLWWIGKIPFGTTLYHVAAAVLFFAIAMYRPPLQRAEWRRGKKSYWRITRRHTGRLQLAVFLILLLSQLLMWSITGLPVLLSSRLDAAAAGGGIGVFVRVASVFSTVAIFLTVMRIGLRGRNYSFTRDVVIIVLILLIQIGNGSKSSIIFTVFYFVTSDWLCRQVLSTYKPIVFSKKLIIVSTLIASVAALVPIILNNLLHTTDRIEGPVVQFITRAILSGDCYIWFWGENRLKDFASTSPTLLLGADLLGTLRLVPREILPTHPGLALYRDIFPFSDEIVGPNMRFDLFGLLYGGWLQGLIFVAVAAVVFNLMRSSIFFSRTPATIMISAHLFLNSPAVYIDPTLGEGVLFNAGLALPILFLLTKLTQTKSRRKKRQAPGGAGPIQTARGAAGEIPGGAAGT